MTNRISIYTPENGGRVILLFLLFLLAIYQLATAGLPAFAVICLAPFLILFVYLIFKWKMLAFWMLVFINYFIHIKGLPMPIPMSLPCEMLQLLLLAIAIIDARQTPNFERCGNLMFFSLIIWCGYCTLEILNDTCGLGINIGAWYNGARLMAFQLLYIFLVFSLYIATPEILKKYLRVWALLSLFSAIWTMKQQYVGLSAAENAFLQSSATHRIQGGTLIRYWSTFSDAASYGCNAAATAVAFIIFGSTTKILADKFLFLSVAFIVVIGMFASGTRTAMVCLFAGFAVYVILSKSFKIAIPSAIMGGLLFFIIAFTTIGQNIQQVRRMRSAFNKNDASTEVRRMNQKTMKKYMKEAPWGIGLGMDYKNVPANNKYRLMATIPPDSEYVFIWLRTGIYGITTFLITTAIMFVGACYIVFFKLKNKSLIGIGAGFCSAFAAIQLAGYGNQILMQFPNGLIFYGGLTIVYLLPILEPEWNQYEASQLAEQEKRRRLKLEKKLASRV